MLQIQIICIIILPVSLKTICYMLIIEINQVQVLSQMFLGLGIRDRDRNFASCWPELQFAYKTFFLTVIITTVLWIVFPGVGEYLPNIITFTIEKVQLWRLFTSFLFHGSKVRAIINALFNVYILYISMPDIERQYSTAYAFVEAFLKLLISNIFLLMVGYPLIYFQLLSDSSMLGLGMLPIIFTFMWHRVSRTPQQPTRFCWFPCNIPMKYVPFCYFILQIAFNNPIPPLIIYNMLGYYQHMIRRKSIVQLPISVYMKFDSIMPKAVTNFKGYVKVVDVADNLRSICKRGFFCWQNSNDQEGAVERVDIIGTGVSIGGNSTSSHQEEKQMKSYWLKKDEDLQIERIKQEIVLKKQFSQEQPEFQSDKIEINDKASTDGKSSLSENPFLGNQQGEAELVEVQPKVSPAFKEEQEYAFQVKY